MPIAHRPPLPLLQLLQLLLLLPAVQDPGRSGWAGLGWVMELLDRLLQLLFLSWFWALVVACVQARSALQQPLWTLGSVATLQVCCAAQEVPHVPPCGAL